MLVVDPVAQFSDGLIFKKSETVFEYLEKFDPKTFRVICRFRDNEEFEQTEEILRLSMELKDVDVVIDEVDKICNANYVSPALFQIINFGRHDRVSLYTSARRPADVARTLTSNADEIVSYRIEEPADLDYLKKRGFDPAKLQTLEKFDFLTNN